MRIRIEGIPNTVSIDRVTMTPYIEEGSGKNGAQKDKSDAEATKSDARNAPMYNVV